MSNAEAFDEQFRVAKQEFTHVDAQGDSLRVVSLWRADRSGSEIVINNPENFHAVLTTMMQQAGADGTGFIAMRFGNSRTVFHAIPSATEDSLDAPLALNFADDSKFIVEQSRNPSTVPRDEGLALLEPITPAEYQMTEGILGEVWKALDYGTLTDVQRAQIVAIAELIKAERDATTPGATKRWKLVAVVGSALRYLAKELPKDALAWVGLVELLTKVDWHNAAQSLRV